ncbi:hypothetical protein L5470_12880 [Synechococcus sp. PCC 6717]|nr:hypothetical protein [Synechococcus sp. PCC 6717]
MKCSPTNAHALNFQNHPEAFKHRLKGLTSGSWGVPMAERIERLNRWILDSRTFT